MNTKKQRWILYFITATIITTIAVQLYWNYKNYEENKQRVLNEIKSSLDESIDDYYTNLSKKNLLTIIEPDNPTAADSLRKKQLWKDFFKNAIPQKKTSGTNKKAPEFKISSIEISTEEKRDFEKTDSIITNDLLDKLNKSYQKDLPKNKKISGLIQLGDNKKKGIHIAKDSANKITSIQVFRGEKARDSIKLIKGLKTMFIAIHNDSLDYTVLDSLLTSKLKSRKINLDFAFNHFKKDTLFYAYNVSENIEKNVITNSNSTYFQDNNRFDLLHTNPSKETLKRSSTGILLSLLLSLAVVSSLFYLLKIINQQKELAEIKNDLISNITHEFKTPITTVSTALEAIGNFNAIDDKEKTKKYVSISNVQLKKLHQMVEKLLETATLDSESLLLQKEEVNIVDLIDKITKKHQLISENKTVLFSSNISEITANIDAFHFENAISNLIDNAIKYGGETVEVNLNSVLNTIEISIVDNGNGIEKNQQEKIFEKFYRVPKGNTHDVKGFGIGLYYTKKIIEKHNGIINLVPNIKNTVFKILLPNE
ncbi:two-component sensor histidine kinase [Tenacibaculum todarodis]|uniref:histidine kinase n=1 Tax=Tenacibaculum todarodis TaxID=1850252 RepID=A0A1L3JMB4_9FLAO|nr:HAMP domain-containing sensor histidine kinase [Tenacibaculum todarodis]APG66243.1 two-component sensor histidine kinase [Tenacibaculum todarodis]